MEFDPEGLRAIAKKAASKGTGARGLRSVIEEVMLEMMYEIPSRKDITEIVITKELVERGGHAFEPKPQAAPEAIPARPVTEPPTRRESA